MRVRQAHGVRKPLVVSTLTLAVLVGMSVADTSRNAVANLGWKEIKLPKPVFAGDTLYAESTVLETRESKSRPNEGVVTIRTLGRNQHGEVVCEFERTSRHEAQPSARGARVFLMENEILGAIDRWLEREVRRTRRSSSMRTSGRRQWWKA